MAAPIQLTCDDDYDPYAPPEATGVRIVVDVNKDTRIIADRRTLHEGIATMLSLECPKSGMKLDIWLADPEVIRLFGEVTAAQSKPVVD